jgi:hypothetical protein
MRRSLSVVRRKFAVLSISVFEVRTLRVVIERVGALGAASCNFEE